MRWWLMLLVGLGLIGSFASVALALAISGLIEHIDHRRNLEPSLFIWFGLGLLLKVSLPFAQERIGIFVSSTVKSQFRRELIETDYSDALVSSAEVSLLITRGLDALDSYFAKFLPQFIYTLVVTPITVVLFFLVDPISAAILVFTIPLIPLFMVFIGRATQLEQERQMESLTKLSSHFAEVVRGLSTLKLFGRINHQLDVLKSIGDTLRLKTMRVLRISFLSGFALELAASLSVALIAVTIGFRLIDGLIPFSTAMFLLILAPDAYLPIRMIGSNYHASSEGIAAASSVLAILDYKRASFSATRESQDGLEIWLGASGAGKTRKLEQMANELNWDLVAWMPQQITLFPGSIEHNITGGENVDRKSLDWAIDLVELSNLSLDTNIDDFGRGLSGGQAQRVSLARALYRFKSKRLRYLLLDEPTSSVDIEAATRIWGKLAKLNRDGVSMVIITHQENFAYLADRVVRFEK